MNLFWGRLLGYVCLSFGLALIAPPLVEPDRGRETVTRPVLYLSASALGPKALAPACAGPPVKVTDQDLEKYPAVKKAMTELVDQGPDRGGVLIFSKEPEAMAANLGRPGSGLLCFSHAGKIYRLKPWIVAHDGRARLWLAGLLNPPPEIARRLSPGQLARYPALAARVLAVEKLSKRAWDRRQRAEERAKNKAAETEKPKADPRAGRSMESALRAWEQVEKKMQAQKDRLNSLADRASTRPYYQSVRLAMPPESWLELMKSLGAYDDWQAFTHGGYLFVGKIREVTESVDVEMSWLFIGRMALGGIVFLLGLWCMRGAYKVGPGIRLNPQWSAVFADVMFILAAGFGAFCAVDYAVHNWFGAFAKMDEALQAVCSFMYVPGVFFLAWFAGNLGGQTLEVTEQGVTRHGPGGASFAPWERINGFALKDTHVLVGRGGFLMPRKLQTMLVVKLGEDRITVVEPGLRRTKTQVISQLAEYAPQRLQGDLTEVAELW